MPLKTLIEWADYSTNPLIMRESAGKERAWTCAKVSPECLNCYAEELNARFGDGREFNVANSRASYLEIDGAELSKILRFKPRGPFKNGRSRPAVFAFDMTDIFGDWVPVEMLDHIFAVFALRPDVDFMILTKRAERMARYWSDPLVGRRIYRNVSAWLDDGDRGFLGREWNRVFDLASRSTEGGPRVESVAWRLPLPNLWLGVSGGAQKFAENRLRYLFQTPAAVRFLSAEPLIGDVDLERMTTDPIGSGFALTDGFGLVDGEGPPLLNLVIAGGESGRKARPCDVATIRKIVRQCKAAGVACFVKQLGQNVVARNDEIADWFETCPHLQQKPTERFQGATGRILNFSSAKGSEPNEWPVDLRVREFPAIAETVTEANA